MLPPRGNNILQRTVHTKSCCFLQSFENKPAHGFHQGRTPSKMRTGWLHELTAKAITVLKELNLIRQAFLTVFTAIKIIYDIYTQWFVNFLAVVLSMDPKTLEKTTHFNLQNQ